MSQGRIIWFNKERGYGFVKSEKGDVFIHYSSFIGDFVPNDNDLISFDIVSGERGLKAEKIILEK